MANQCQATRFDVLPDDVLLGIFDFYMVVDQLYEGKAIIEEWQSLVHVCRRWRNLVLASPLRLNLRLYCTPETPARHTLDVWPALPLIVEGYMDLSTGTDNLIAALGRSNRVCQVILELTGWQLEDVVAAMQVPFPELTGLRLTSKGKTLPVIPDSFLDGSAPHLQYFNLDGIPFPGLPKLLLSSTHLVTLSLSNIPHSGYFSPDAMAALLSALASLKELTLVFQSPRSRPVLESRRPPLSKRSAIAALACLKFKGVTEYLEDLVTFIDTPQLDVMHITFFNQIDFDIPRLAQFINRLPRLTKHDAVVEFDDDFARVGLQVPVWFGNVTIENSCKEPDWQLSFTEQVCNSLTCPIFMVENLYIKNRYWELVWKDDAIEKTLWLQLLLPFTTVKNLYLCKEFAPGIAAALQELDGGRITGVLPSLQSIFVEWLKPSGPFQENIEPFVAARRLSDQPIAISDWDKS